ncbi:phosphoglucosamine mutase [uncultured Pyramidobacter sp.]|uniref:phosphoglucosamine mutase n=1 Tax=uncultured Pyramidobacter sp. TaxID=1623495 RepID=UPI0025836C09|nr:phosphoglucosamine mutase [uncultured Pyramidobacter sp.]
MDVKSTPAPRCRCLFGTDGVRDIANRGSMTPEMALRLGRAYVLFLIQRGTPRPKIVVGRDTRRSGRMLESALVAGMMSAGAEVILLGVIPTPAVSYGVLFFKAQGGAVISASHNPPEYNGIKFLSGAGQKLRDSEELEIEDYLGDDLIDDWRPSGASIGEMVSEEGFAIMYADRVLQILDSDRLSGMKIVFDCANGAASTVVPLIAQKLECESVLIGAEPDGLNINEKSGVMHLEALTEAVRANDADIGIAYDGDADRVLLVDRQGKVIDGDIVLWVLARWLQREGILGSGVVATVMSNGILENHLRKEGIQVFRCAVGDRYVLDMMKSTASGLGGEQSGHVIIDHYVRTGDGLCTGFAFLRACRELGEVPETLVDRFDPFPQELTNITVSDRDKVMQDAELRNAIEQTNRELGTTGRVFLRSSGTEPLIRLLVECKDRDTLAALSDKFGAMIRAL